MEPRKSNRIIWIVGIVIVVLLVILAVRNSQSSDTGPIKVGVLLPLTGDAGAYGEPARTVYQLAVDEINQAGGINGRNINLIVEDSKCTGTDAASAAQKLVNIDKVQIILGGFCSSESLAAIPITEKAKVVLFSVGSSNPGLTNVSPYFFRDYPSDASQGKVLADIAYNDKGWRSVAFIQEQTDYANGVYKAFSDEFTQLGGRVTNNSFPTDTTDFRAIITKIKAAQPDAVFLDVQTAGEGARIMTQAQQLQFKPKLLVSDTISSDDPTVKKYSVFLEGALAAEFGVDAENPKFQTMMANYKAKYGTDAPYPSFAQTEYDAVYIIKDALLAVGNNGQKIATWSRTIKNWPGTSGNVTILPTGDRESGHSPMVITGGKVIPYTK